MAKKLRVDESGLVFDNIDTTASHSALFSTTYNYFYQNDSSTDGSGNLSAELAAMYDKINLDLANAKTADEPSVITPFVIAPQVDPQLVAPEQTPEETFAQIQQAGGDGGEFAVGKGVIQNSGDLFAFALLCCHGFGHGCGRGCSRCSGYGFSHSDRLRGCCRCGFGHCCGFGHEWVEWAAKVFGLVVTNVCVGHIGGLDQTIARAPAADLVVGGDFE